MNASGNPRKLVSKFYRLKLRDELEKSLMDLPVEGLEESQVGDFIYSGYGRMHIGSSYALAWVRVRMINKIVILTVKVPKYGIQIAHPLGHAGIADALREAARRTLS